METPLQVSYRNVAKSAALDDSLLTSLARAAGEFPGEHKNRSRPFDRRRGSIERQLRRRGPPFNHARRPANKLLEEISQIETLGFVNAVVRPVMTLLTLPLTVLTLGLFYLVVNAAAFGLAAALVPGFSVASFWSALLGALVVSLVSWVVGAFLTPKS